MWRKHVVAIVAAGLVMIGFLGAASAQNFRAGDHTTVGPDEVIDSSLWISGRSLDIAGQVNGDVFCAGQNVTVSGTVRGDLLCAAQTITVTGVVTGDVRLAAQTMTISGTVIHNLSAIGQSYNQGSKANVRGDVSVGAADITINGKVGRDAALGGQTVSVGAAVGRNIKANATDIRLTGSAKVAGNFEYTSSKNANLENGAAVQGKTVKSEPQERPEHKAKTSLAGFGLGLAFYLLAAGLLVALVLSLLFPQLLHTVTEYGLSAPWKSLLVGLVAGIVTPALIILLAITVIGIPLALMLLLAWILVQALAGFMFAYYLGRVIWKSQRNPILIMLFGTLILILLYFIPIIGVIAFIVAMLLGTGMILLELNHRRPAPKYNLPAHLHQ